MDTKRLSNELWNLLPIVGAANADIIYRAVEYLDNQDEGE